MTGPGNPSDTRSNFQSRTDFLTTRTILRGVMPGPDGYFRGSFCPVASILMFVPPTSITRTLGDLPTCAVFITEPEELSDLCYTTVSFPVGSLPRAATACWWPRAERGAAFNHNKLEDSEINRLPPRSTVLSDSHSGIRQTSGAIAISCALGTSKTGTQHSSIRSVPRQSSRRERQKTYTKHWYNLPLFLWIMYVCRRVGRSAKISGTKFIRCTKKDVGRPDAEVWEATQKESRFLITQALTSRTRESLLLVRTTESCSYVFARRTEEP